MTGLLNFVCTICHRLVPNPYIKQVDVHKDFLDIGWDCPMCGYKHWSKVQPMEIKIIEEEKDER